MFRVMALDYGDKTIGVAVSDPLGITAQPLLVIRRDDEKSIKKSILKLKEIILEFNINAIVLGFPKNMNNTEGIRCEKTLLFKERLERNFKKTPIYLWDERLSTAGACKNLTSISRKQREAIIDKMSAAFILEGFMQANKNLFVD